jgi:hypothetical protein
MEGAYNFIKITLLGLILGILIVFCLHLNNWTNNIKKTIGLSVVHRYNDHKQKPLIKRYNRPPVNKLPNIPKYKI